jgi:hypothetical protein
MPNWPISGAVRSYIINRAIHLSNRALDYARADFPLSSMQIQYAIMPEDRVDTLKKLINEGVRTIEKHRQIRVAFLRETLPELRRGAVVSLVLPEWVVVDRSTHFGIASTKFSMTEQHYLVPKLSCVSPESRAELVTWINRVIRQKRLHEIVIRAVGEIMHNHAPTCAHLHQIWPTLTTLINSDAGLQRQRHDRELYNTWSERFRAPARALKSYRPKPDVINSYAKLIHAADTAITAGMVLASYSHDPKKLTAELEHWEPVEGDRTFA